METPSDVCWDVETRWGGPSSISRSSRFWFMWFVTVSASEHNHFGNSYGFKDLDGFLLMDKAGYRCSINHSHLFSSIDIKNLTENPPWNRTDLLLQIKTGMLLRFHRNILTTSNMSIDPWFSSDGWPACLACFAHGTDTIVSNRHSHITIRNAHSGDLRAPYFQICSRCSIFFAISHSKSQCPSLQSSMFRWYFGWLFSRHVHPFSSCFPPFFTLFHMFSPLFWRIFQRIFEEFEDHPHAPGGAGTHTSGRPRSGRMWLGRGSPPGIDGWSMEEIEQKLGEWRIVDVLIHNWLSCGRRMLWILVNCSPNHQELMIFPMILDDDWGESSGCKWIGSLSLVAGWWIWILVDVNYGNTMFLIHHHIWFETFEHIENGGWTMKDM